MGLITKTYTFSTGATVLAAEHNTNYDTLFNWANGNVDNANIKASAGILFSKLSLSDDVTLTGDISFTNSATTDDVVTVTASSLTTGSALKVYSNSADTTARNVMEIINDNAAADAACCLQIQQDGDAAHINLSGDPANSTPVDGDVWYDGSNVKLYNGSSTVTLGGAGTTVQVVNTQTGAVNTGTTIIPYDDSIPQITEGDEFMTLAITPTSSTNKLKIDVVFHGYVNGNERVAVALFQDTTAGALSCGWVYLETIEGQICFTHYMDAGTTSETTFRVRAGQSSAATLTFNGVGGVRKYGGVVASSITITEIAV